MAVAESLEDYSVVQDRRVCLTGQSMKKVRSKGQVMSFWLDGLDFIKFGLGVRSAQMEVPP